MISHKLTASALAVAALMGTATTASAVTVTNVDTELSLVIDVSGSVSSSEYTLQLDGYIAAFRDSAVHNAITNGNIGAIAVNAIAFASGAAEKVGFTLIDSAASSNAFANLLDTLFNRSGVGSGTNIYNGVDLATSSFAGNGFNGARQVIDVSGDGTDSVSLNQAARDAACGAGGVEAINGIAIENSTGSTSITDFYQNNVICGDGSFVITSTGFDTFADGIKQKLISEITTPSEVPLPAPAALLLAGLAGLGVMRRKKS